MEILKIAYDGTKLAITAKNDKDYTLTHKRKLQGNSEFDRWWNHFRHEVRVMLPISSKMITWIEEISINENKTLKLSVIGIMPELEIPVSITIDSVDADLLPCINQIFEQCFAVLDEAANHIKHAQIELFAEALDALDKLGATVSVGYKPETGETIDDEDPGDVDDDMDLIEEEYIDPDATPIKNTIRQSRMRSVISE